RSSGVERLTVGHDISRADEAFLLCPSVDLDSERALIRKPLFLLGNVNPAVAACRDVAHRKRNFKGFDDLKRRQIDVRNHRIVADSGELAVGTERKRGWHTW